MFFNRFADRKFGKQGAGTGFGAFYQIRTFKGPPNKFEENARDFVGWVYRS